MKINTLLYFALLFCFWSCKTDSKKSDTPETTTTQIKTPKKDTSSTANVDISTQIATIKSNYKLVESSLNSLPQKIASLDGEPPVTISLQGYFDENHASKIISEETAGHSASLVTYYAKNGNLFFVFEQRTEESSVNGPFTAREVRTYIADGKIIKILTKEKTFNYSEKGDLSNIPNKDITQTSQYKDVVLQKYIDNYNKYTTALKNGKDVSSLSEKIDLTSFTIKEFPDEIDGCACYFSNNQAEFKKGIYVYADNYENVAFIRINGKETKFKLQKTVDPSKNSSIQTWFSSHYTLIITTKKVSQLDETWQRSGTLVLKSGDNVIVTKNIYGECGC